MSTEPTETAKVTGTRSVSPTLPHVATLAPFAALSATYFAHIGFFNPFLSLWLKDLGLSLLAISVLTSIQAATRLFAPYGWGWISDSTGERVMLLRIGATLAMLASLGLWLDWGIVWLSIVLAVMFTNTSAMMPMSEAAMAHVVSHGGTFDARRYGRVRVWGSVGFLVAVFFAGAWFEHFGMQHFVAWTVATMLVLCGSVWWIPNVKEAPHTPGAVRLSVWPILRQPVVRWFFITLFFHVLSHVGIMIFFSLYCDSLGYSKTTIGMLWAISVVTEIVWFFNQGRWLPRFSLTAWLLVCAGVTVVRMGLTASFAPVLAVLIVAQALHAVTFAMHHTVCIALLSHHFPGRLRGRGQALYTVIGYGFSGVLGGITGGYMSTQFGLPSVYWLSLATALLACACALRVWRLQHSRQLEAAS